MQIQEFITLFRTKITQLIDAQIIAPSKKEERLNPGDWTFLINCAVFDIVKEYNAQNGTELAICAEPEVNKTPAGRGGYADLLICSKDGQEEHIVIEHENFPDKRLAQNVEKLSKFKAKHKILITYHFDNYEVKEIVDELKNYVSAFFQKNEPLHLLIAYWKTDSGDDYDYQQIEAKNKR